MPKSRWLSSPTAPPVSPLKRADAAVAPEAIALPTIAPPTTVARDHSPPEPETTVAPLATVPEATAGYTRIPNTLLDDLLPTLDQFEQLVFLRLYRLAWGHGRPTCKVGYAKLAEKTRLSRKTIQRTVDRLERRRLIRRLSTDALSADKGSVYEVTQVGEAIAREATARETRARRTTVAREARMKDSETKHETSAVYELRKIAVRLRAIYPEYGPERLRDAVGHAADGQGLEYTAAELDDALRGM